MDYEDDFGDDYGPDYNNFGPGMMGPGPGGPPMGRRNVGYPKYDRYSNAYGNYRGGYGPGEGFGHPPLLRPPGPMGHMGPPMMMMGRGFGPGGPPLQRHASPENQIIRFLMRCGVAKESLKNLPRQLLHLMEADYCGICAIGFDSFTMSRMHYTSKNHSKNQRKWLTQNSAEANSGNGREIPLKSRELYCELCDVHITSKTHADSHYSGKPHRAIVFGRKNPKNPYLLQKGMENRVEQLIRREKKNIKPDEKQESADKQPKINSPELFCDICKTSVTCSEQMTMHLNGKKHLSREKQHIIRIMNGETDDQQDDNTETEVIESKEENEPSEEQVAVNDENGGNENDEDDGGDWGNGTSEAWEN